MKIPRNLKGTDLVQILCKTWDYKIVNQEGSHIILETETPSHHRLYLSESLRKRQILAPLIIFIYCLIFKGAILNGWHECYYTFQRDLIESTL